MTTRDEWIERARRGEKDLERAHLEGSMLVGANLEGANLRDANLRDANLEGSILVRASLKHANLEGSIVVRANLEEANLERANLKRADVKGAHLEGAKLRAANLERADLERAHLERADLTTSVLLDAHLREAQLQGANLEHADLERADLKGANLEGANLEGANLEGANLERADLERAKFDRCTVGYTTLVAVDVGPLCRASGVVFQGPCTVDHRSIVLSVREPHLKDFLRRCGMPEVFIEYNVDCARSLDPGVMFSLMQSTFVTYGRPDEAFAKKLNAALQKEGVFTFFFPHDAVPGRTLRETMHRGVNEHDRVILVCSQNSLDRKGLLNELEETLRREADDGGVSYLIPIMLDDAVLTWKPEGREDIAQSVRHRVMADFRGWADDEKVFAREVAKLVRALKKSRKLPAEEADKA